MADDQGAQATLVMPMNSLHEGALVIVLEVVLLKLKERLGITAEERWANHTNLE